MLQCPRLPLPNNKAYCTCQGGFQNTMGFSVSHPSLDDRLVNTRQIPLREGSGVGGLEASHMHTALTQTVSSPPQ